MSDTTINLTYEETMQAVDAITRDKIGLSFEDLPDLILTRDLYDDGSTVEEIFALCAEAWSEDLSTVCGLSLEEILTTTA